MFIPFTNDVLRAVGHLELPHYQIFPQHTSFSIYQSEANESTFSSVKWHKMEFVTEKARSRIGLEDWPMS